MNILILTGCFGMGHYKAADALKENLQIVNPDANIYTVDIINYMFPKINRIIYKLFNIMVGKYSKLYNVLNKLAERFGSVPFKNSGIKKIDKLLSKYNTDIVVSTFPLSSRYISIYKKETNNKDILLYTYVTDIVVNDEWISDGTDLYFVGTNKSKQHLKARGIEDNKIIVSGIPVSKKFVEQEMNCNDKIKKEILIMGGGLGLMPFSCDFIDRLSKNKNLNVTVITGKNKKLKKHLEKKYDNLNIIGYVNNVEEYMKRADLLITKAGGITTFEAIHCQTPMYVINPSLMQEVGNAEFISEENIGKVIWSEKNDIIDNLDNLLEDENLLDKMKNNMHNIKNTLSEICPKEYFA